MKICRRHGYAVSSIKEKYELITYPNVGVERFKHWIVVDIIYLWNFNEEFSWYIHGYICKMQLTRNNFQASFCYSIPLTAGLEDTNVWLLWFCWWHSTFVILETVGRPARKAANCSCKSNRLVIKTQAHDSQWKFIISVVHIVGVNFHVNKIFIPVICLNFCLTHTKIRRERSW